MHLKAKYINKHAHAKKGLDFHTFKFQTPNREHQKRKVTQIFLAIKNAKHSQF